MTDPRLHVGGFRRPAIAGLSGHDRPFGRRAGQDVVLGGLGRPGVIARNGLAALIDKQDRVPSARVKVGEILPDHEAVGVEPGAGADPAAGIRRIIVIVGVPLRAQVSSPRLVSVPCGGRQVLAKAVRAGQAAQVAGLILSAADKGAHGRRARSAGSANAVVPMAAGDNEGRHNCEKRDAKFYKVFLHGFLLSQRPEIGDLVHFLGSRSQAEAPGTPFDYDIHLRIAKLFRIGFKKLGLCGRAGNGQHAEQNGQPLRDLPRHKISRMKGRPRIITSWVRGAVRRVLLKPGVGFES